MELKVLGCSGGVGGQLRTTTLLIDDDILIDAGTGLGDLNLQAMSCIRHIFLTHSHLDHITSIPFLVDTMFENIREPIVIHGLESTIDALKNHIFNNIIWPDFASLPNSENPVMQYQVMQPGEIIELGQRKVEMIEVNHIVAGVGYRVESETGAFAFSGDTTTNDTFWDALNKHDNLNLLLVESAFTNKDVKLCHLSGHYCAELLGPDVAKLKHQATVYISHNKPGAELQIFSECQKAITSHSIHPLSSGQSFTI
ncbi:MAG: 3',5'-cyclic-nucleotide phosphodiesterase [Gammaproteobacteria bacterium]|nr:3',5'-cyclic-nucleotide phosphodiesterase [Gammaproteobacteria bacterium]MCW9030664.1 3',5'-cyclic-nucleotide phosphodiesterase [Gammaproteobacteria bacterium]